MFDTIILSRGYYTQPSWKIMEILESGGYDKHPLEWKFERGWGV